MDKTDSRKSKITPEHLEEAERLRHIWDATYEDRKLKGLHSQGAFGAEYDIGNQAAVGFFLNGKTALSLKAARGFAAGLGCKVSDFSPRLGTEIDSLSQTQNPVDPDEFAQVRRVDVSVSAGHGALVVEEYSKSALTFRRSFLQEIGVTPHSAVIVTVKGRSMEPTIRDGAVLLVSTSAKTVVSGEVYAFRQDGHLYVKRMHRQPDGGLLAVSDNPDREAYPDMAFTAYAQDFEIIGRALWMGARL